MPGKKVLVLAALCIGLIRPTPRRKGLVLAALCIGLIRPTLVVMVLGDSSR